MAQPSRSGNAARRVSDALTAPLHLIFPTILLMTITAGAYLYGDTRVAWLGAVIGEWLTLGHLLLPLTFLAIHITNRRYGAGYAFAQIVSAWAFGAAILWSMRGHLPFVASGALPDARELFAFGSALLLAQIMAVLVFDVTRGPRWWQAPFFASLWGGVVMSLIAFPVAYSGTPVDWIGHMVIYLGITSAAAFALVIPYWAIRGIVPPLSGFGGY